MPAFLKLFDILPGWVWALVTAGALALVGVQQVRVSNAKAGTAAAQIALAEDRATYAQAAQVAEQAARAEETRREAAKQEVIDEAKKESAAAQAAARTADAAAAGLRKQVAAYVTAIRSSTANPGPAGGSSREPGADPLDLLADLYGRTDQAAGDIARYAGELRVAGGACERYADRLQPAAQP